MFGNLLRRMGYWIVCRSLPQNELVNLISILLGIAISVKMQYEEFLQIDTLMVIGLGSGCFHYGLDRWSIVC